MIWIQRLGFMLFQFYLRGRLLGGARRQGLLMYFKAVNGARRILVVLAALSVMLHLMVVSVLGLVVTATWIWVRDESLRLYVLFGAFAVLFLIPLIVVYILLSERFWLQLSGAGALINDGSST